MPDPKQIERFLQNRFVQRFLRFLTRKRSGGRCILDDIFAKYGDEQLGLFDRLRYSVPFRAADAMRRKAGASLEQVRDKVFRHPARARALVNTARAIGRYGLTRPQVFSAPLMVVWNFTQACNLKCAHCYQDAHRRMPDELNLREQLRIVDELAWNDVPLIAFSGGEPMMTPTFWPVLAHTGKKGFHISIATNGTYLTEELACRLGEQKVNYVEISLDSVDPAKHDRFRGGKGYWQKAVDGIKAAVAAREKHGHTFGVGLAATITRMNYAELDDLIAFAEELGCTSFYAFNFIPTGRARDIVETDIEPHQREQMLKTLYARMCEGGIGMICSAPQLSRVCVENRNAAGVINTGHYGYGPGANAKILSEYIGGCGAGRCYFAIQPDGKVTPCVFMPLTVGDLRRQSIQEIWRNSAAMQTLRNRELLEGHCGVCDYKIYCGGCRARAFGYYGELTKADPGCRYNVVEWQRLKESPPTVKQSAAASR
jgi:radical SAM protein with 4Fe4S-binding SPASM domain